MNKLQIIFMGLLVNPIWGYDNTDIPDLQRLVDIWTRQERILHNIRVDYTFAVRGPNVEKLDKGDLRLVGSQTNLFIAEKPFDKKFMIIQKQRLEGLRRKPFELYKWKTYNSHIYRELEISDRNNTPVGLIAEKPPLDADINLTPLGFTFFHRCWGGGGLSLLDILTLRKNDPNLLFSLNPAVTRVNDCDSVELICSRKWLSEKTVKMMSVYFSLNHHLSIVKIVYYNAGGSVSEFNVRKFRPVGNDLWFPVQCDITSSGGDINEISVADVRVNQVLEGHEFELEFPPGTKVRDTITGKQYTIKPAQEQVDQVLDCK